MADFSVILQDPKIRSIVQENALERAFHDGLFPNMMFRAEAAPSKWNAQVGDTQIFTAANEMEPDLVPLAPGVDPTPAAYGFEQWEATAQSYAGTIDTHMPTNMMAIASLFMRNAQQLGLKAAKSMNRKVRNRMYNAAESGVTVAAAAIGGGGSTSLQVQRLNGFTKARRPTLAGASTVRFAAVSPTNPLPISINNTGGPTTRNVIGFTPSIPGDEIGPGTLLLDASIADVPSRAYVRASDCSNMVFVGGGLQVDDIGTSDILTLSAVQQGVATMWQDNVREHEDGRFHIHLDPISLTQIFRDTEFQRLNESLPEYVIYREMAVSQLLNCYWYRNSECPIAQTVKGGSTATYTSDDDFAPELYHNGNATTGVKLHRALITGRGGIMEHWVDQSALYSEAGVDGKVGPASRIMNDGISVDCERIHMIIRSPQNRLQDMVSHTYRFIGDWPARTDAGSGSTARYKRFCTIVHGQ